MLPVSKTALTAARTLTTLLRRCSLGFTISLGLDVSSTNAINSALPTNDPTQAIPTSSSSTSAYEMVIFVAAVSLPCLGMSTLKSPSNVALISASLSPAGTAIDLANEPYLL